MGLVNEISRETVLRQYVDSVKRDYALLDCRPHWVYAGHQHSARIKLCACLCSGELSGGGGYDRTDGGVRNFILNQIYWKLIATG